MRLWKVYDHRPTKLNAKAKTAARNYDYVGCARAYKLDARERHSDYERILAR